jgi:outer membrane receptor protein involved in Fe transport
MLSAGALALAESPKPVDIPAGDLTAALETLEKQSGVELVYSPELLRGVRTRGVHGTLTSAAAVTRLLEGTRLSLHTDKTGVLLVTDAAAGASVGAGKQSASDPATVKQEDGKNSSHDFRVAQVAEARDGAGLAPQKDALDDRVQLAEIIVTAQKRQERLQDVPVPVTAINAQTLVDNNQLHLRDYYSQVPGLSMTFSNTGAPNLTIRGISTGNGTNPTVGIVIDDVPYGSTTALGDGFIAPDIDPSDLARVEVLRGPQGTLYGASSIGGLVKYVTVDPSTDAISGRLEADASGVYHGAQPGYGVRGAINVPLSDTAAFRATGYYHDDPGYVDNVQTGESHVNRGDSAGAHLTFLWRPQQDLSVKLSALFQDSKRYGSPDVYVGAGLADLQQDMLRGTGGYTNTIQAYSATLKAKWGGIDITAVTGYGLNELYQPLDLTSLLGPPVGATFPGYPGAGIFGRLKTEKFSQEIRLSGALGEHFDWLAGVFYTHESNPAGPGSNLNAVDPATGAIGGTYLYDAVTSTYQEYAAFTDLTVHFTDRFDIQIGGRESQNKQGYSQVQAGPYVTDLLGVASPQVQPQENTKDNAFTYLVTPRLRLSPDLMVYARLASGYRVGGPNTLATVYQVPTHFSPDTTRNYELGIKGDVLDHRLNFDGSLYYIDWKNIQLNVIDPVTGEGYIANASRAKSQGIELSADSRPLPGLSLSGWVAWNLAELTRGFPPLTSSFLGNAGDRLPYGSRFSGSFSAQQDFALTNGMTLFVAGTESYVGYREGEFVSAFASSPQRQSYSPYARTDLRAGAKLDTWTFNLFLNNATDRRGVLSGGIGFYPENAFTYIQPRTAGFSVAKVF